MNLERRPDHSVNWPRAVQSSVAILGALSFGAMAYGYGAGYGGGRTETYPQGAAAVSGEVVISDGFESGDFTSPSGTGSWGAIGTYGGADTVLVTDSIARTGTYSAAFVFNGGADDTDARSELNCSLGDTIPEIWMEWYFYLSSGSEQVETGTTGAAFKTRNQTGATNNKWVRLWHTTYGPGGGGNDIGASWKSTDPAGDSLGAWGVDWDVSGGGVGFDDGAIVDSVLPSPAGGVPAFPSLELNIGQWHRWRMHFKLAVDTTVTSDGVQEVWFDDVKIVDRSGLNFVNRGGSPQSWTDCYVLGSANSGFDSNTIVFIDDLTFYSSNPGW